MQQDEIKTARIAAGLTATELAAKLLNKKGKPSSKQYIQRLESMHPGTTASESRLAEIAAIIAKADEVRRFSAYVWQK